MVEVLREAEVPAAIFKGCLTADYSPITCNPEARMERNRGRPGFWSRTGASKEPTATEGRVATR